MSRRGRLRWIRWLVLAVSIVLAVYLGAAAYWRYHYPYGWSHCCDKNLAFALRDYAKDHGGAYPAGEATSEASLSLLHRGGYGIGAEILRGKIVPRDVVQNVIDAGELLTPETCGWHYVEGLRTDDDPRLALFWDKVGLGHFGRRLSTPGHYVWFVDGMSEFIEASRWEEFLAEQRALRAKRK